MIAICYAGLVPMGPGVGVLFNVIPNLWHDILHEYNLLRRFGPDGTVVWACYLMLFRTYGTTSFMNTICYADLVPMGPWCGRVI